MYLSTASSLSVVLGVYLCVFFFFLPACLSAAPPPAGPCVVTPVGGNGPTLPSGRALKSIAAKPTSFD